MECLNIDQIRNILAQKAPAPPPRFVPTSASVGPYECPVCLIYRHETMLIHTRCNRAICARCLLNSIDRGSDCPYCRTDLFEDPCFPDISNVTKPTPNDQYWLDRIMFECTVCKQILAPEKTTSHQCQPEPPKHQPPAYIDQWGKLPIATREVVSNPPSSSGQQKRRDSLFIYYFNGRQICSKFVPNAKKGEFIIKQIAEIADVANSRKKPLKVYKFCHQEIQMDTLVRDVANKSGATYIVAFNDLPPFDNKAVKLNFMEFGPPLVIERPMPPQEQQQQQQAQQQPSSSQQDQQSRTRFAEGMAMIMAAMQLPGDLPRLSNGPDPGVRDIF